MRIDTLELVNFRSYARATFTLKQQTYIVGENNAGKSTAIDALLWALTGRCRGLDGSNRDMAELVREGQQTGLGVRVTLADFGSVQRQTNGREVFLKVKEWEGPNAKQQEALYEKLATTEAVLQACLDNAAFLNLHHADAKRLIMGVLNVRIPAAALEPLGVAGPLSPDELDARYQSVMADRRGAKATLAQQLMPAEPSLQAFGGDEPPPVEDLRRQLEGVRGEERALFSDNAETRGRREALVLNKDDVQASIADIQRRLPTYSEHDIHTQLDELDERLALMTDGATPEQGSLIDDEAAPAENPIEHEHEHTKSGLADERGRLRMLESLIGRVEEHDPAKGCVLQGGIPCKTPAKDFKDYLTDSKKDRRELQKSIKAAETRIAEIEAELDMQIAADREAARKRQQAHSDRRGLELKASTLRSTLTRLQDDTARLTDLRAQLARIDSDLATIGDVQLPSGIVAIRDRILRGEQLIRDVEVYQTAAGAWREASARRLKLEQRVARCEHLCDQLGPKGVIVDVLEQARVMFEQTVNQALDKWGYHLEFQIDPWTVRVNGRKANQLAVSERLRAGVALQLAIAEITGTWLVAIDAVDMLDSKRRTILADVIDGWPGQIILAATKDPDYEMPAELPAGVAMYRLELRDDVTVVASALATVTA